MAYELARVNIGRPAAPFTSPQLTSPQRTDVVDGTIPPGGAVAGPGQADWLCRA
ncbi:hypothetical protein [Amycolatopsis granulosa]|uniref:hypothetical protein n=1 Tax=Amycolatopsis granulosa TaxID=185684 RepID=UPI001421372A|nr:hypothetical protein [Amycolatopsis granulosa]NIH87915.1 hypothetical protein [Amycolatopsis granulosa]